MMTMVEEQGQTSDRRPDVISAGGRRIMLSGQRLSSLLLWRPRDPDLTALRRAARAAIVIPLALAVALFVLHNPQVTLYVAFGCFALLVFGDFGGSRQLRAAAYLGVTLVGLALVSLGTLASFSPWIAAPATLLIGFMVSFAGVFGGYAAAAQSPLLLAFVVSVAVPAPPAAIPSRLTGWVIAGVVSTMASVALWPRFEHSTLRSQATAACHALASLVRAMRTELSASDLSNTQQEAETAVLAVVRAYTSAPSRPAGPARRDRAFASLLTELERILGYVTRPAVWSLSAQHPSLLEGDALAAQVVQTLEASGDVLAGGAPPDLISLQAARQAHRIALDRWASDALRAASQPEEVLAGFDADNPLRVVALLALALGADALIAMGRPLPQELQLPLVIPREEGVAGVLQRIGETIHTHLHPSSRVFQNGLRVAIGLALAVLLGGLLQVAHAFWVVLGTISALRSSALATGRTTVEALAGTAIGVVIGAPFIYLVGTHILVLWIAFPAAIFFAAYATTVIGFAAGQAAFTLVILILFNLLAPSGWTLGLVRLENVALGVGISVLVGLLLWPRGLRDELRRALADLYHAVTNDLATAFDQILGLGAAETFVHAQAEAVRAAEREGDALDQYVRERGSRRLAPEIAGALGAAARNALVAGDLLHALADSGYHVQAPGVTDAALLDRVRALTHTYAQLGNQLDQVDSTGQPTAQPENDAVVHTAMLDALRRWKEDPAAEQAAVAIVAAGSWARNLATLAADQEAAVIKVVEAAQAPWWR
jgi:uncharacterized membrane protein YccC